MTGQLHIFSGRPPGRAFNLLFAAVHVFKATALIVVPQSKNQIIWMTYCLTLIHEAHPNGNTKGKSKQHNWAKLGNRLFQTLGKASAVINSP